MSKLLKIDRKGMPLADKVLFNKYFPEEISDDQADMMLHALGADYRSFRKYRERRYYHAYRNFYDAGGRDVTAWDDLVANGYARKHGVYHVTVKGIHALEYLTQCRIWGNYQCPADCRYVVLVELMRDSVSCGYGCWLPTSSNELSMRLAMPRSLILETLKELTADDLVRKDYYGEMDDEGYVHCKHGWTLTKAAKEKYHEKYEELQQAEYQKIEESLRRAEL